VAHLRWDLKAILDLAVADGIVATNQAQELYIPRILKTVNKRAATPKDVLAALAALFSPSETVRLPLIFRLAVYVGLRPGEIMGLKWEHVGAWSLQIQQRVYRGKVEASTKNNKTREVAIPKSVRNDLRTWREHCTESEWIFPSTTDAR
jgi:integrase